MIQRFIPTNAEEFRKLIWEVLCYPESHTEMLDRLQSFPWFESLKYHWYTERYLWTFKNYPIRKGATAPPISFRLELAQANLGAFWKALCIVDSTVLQCDTGDLETLLFFLRRLPLF